jgi:hypothetical protein
MIHQQQSTFLQISHNTFTLYAQTPSQQQQQTRKKKKNKYAQFSNQETLDPMDALLLESRSKLKQISKQQQSNNINKKKKKQAEIYDSSLDAVEELLSSMSNIVTFDDDDDEEKKDKVWERNKRKFPDNKNIDPYDPTTYGYTELGT